MRAYSVAVCRCGWMDFSYKKDASGNLIKEIIICNSCGYEAKRPPIHIEPIGNIAER